VPDTLKVNCELAFIIAFTVDTNKPDSLRRIALNNKTQLRMVARMIAGREELGMRRQIFFVGAGDWDTHDNQSPRLNGLTSGINSAMASFQRTLATLGVENDVTTFTASDFGRTLTVNGDGSDHGWGGHYMVMGGALGSAYGHRF